MKQILVPSDFSLAAQNALDYALALAKKLHLDIILLNAYAMPRSGSAVMIDVSDVLKQDAERKLEEERKRVASKLGNVSLTTLAQNGMMVPCISYTCKDYPVDLIVMGTTGATGLKETFIGSNTASLIAEINIPMIAVPRNFSGDRINNIVLSTDLIHFEKYDVFDPLKSLIKEQSEAHITLLNISESLSFVNPKTFVDEAIDVDDVFQGIEHTFKFLEGTDVEKVLLEFLSKEKADLLVVVSRKRGFFKKLFHKSISKKLTMHSPIPIMVLSER